MQKKKKKAVQGQTSLPLKAKNNPVSAKLRIRGSFLSRLLIMDINVSSFCELIDQLDV